MVNTKTLIFTGRRNEVPEITGEMQVFSNSLTFINFHEHFSWHSEWLTEMAVPSGQSDWRPKKSPETSNSKTIGRYLQMIL